MNTHGKANVRSAVLSILGKEGGWARGKYDRD